MMASVPDSFRRGRASEGEGFTLMELLIVIIVLSIMIAIAVPAFLRSRISANESSAQAGLKAIFAAEMTYREVSGTYDFTNIQDINTGMQYLDPVLSTGIKSGYSFHLYTMGGTTFTGEAIPVTPGRTGVRYFFLDLSGVVRYNPGGPATSGDPPVQ